MTTITPSTHPFRTHYEIAHAHNLVAYLIKALNDKNPPRELLAVSATLSWVVHDQCGGKLMDDLFRRIEGLFNRYQTHDSGSSSNINR
jgi:hypothetical protein